MSTDTSSDKTLPTITMSPVGQPVHSFHSRLSPSHMVIETENCESQQQPDNSIDSSQHSSGVPTQPSNTPAGPTTPGKSGGVTPLTGPATDISSISATSISSICVGSTNKFFNIHTSLLVARSPWFRELLQQHPQLINNLEKSLPELTFEDIDEFAFALFTRWLYGAMLNGPSDFHSMNHYVGLYAVAIRFKVYRLCNEVMDMVRAYYRNSNMTSPPARLEFIYLNTAGANHMKRFLVHTAAFRTVCENGGGLSKAMAQAISGGGELAIDFCNALVALHRNGLVDVRRGADCEFHDHRDSKKCGKWAPEPYMDA